MSGRPLPEIDPDSRPYWEATARSELIFQRCGSCERAVFYPRNTCPHCGSAELTWEQSAGLGTVYTFTIARKPAGPGFTDRVPLTVALVDVDEGYRMMTNIIGDPDRVRIGARVRVAFERLTDEVTLPVFELVG